MSLENWLNNSWLVKHESSREEISNLFGLADRDLKDAQTSGLSPDWRMNIAYNAALQMATAALAAEGYRASRDSHHYRVIQSLSCTIGAERSLVFKFDQFRKKRNLGGYEQAGLVSDQEADEMISLAKELRVMIENWVKQHHPELW